MTDIIFSFDTEDFTSELALDCIREEAELLTEEGVRGCFCVVGLVAKRLAEDGRQDVIEALKKHEVHFHTYSHSVRPIMDVMTDIEDAELATALAKAREDLGLQYLRKAFPNAEVLTTCPPGNETSYAAMYAYADLGLKIYAGTCCDTVDGQGAYYCNMYHMAYTEPLDAFLFRGGDKELAEILDSAAKKKHAILYTHPNMLRFRQFWDDANYRYKNPHVFGAWKACEKRPEEESKRFLDNYRKLIRMIKQDERFRVTTYKEIWEQELARGFRSIKRADLPEIRAKIRKCLYPLQNPCSLSLADVFEACRFFLQKEGTARDIACEEEVYDCGKVYGFLQEPRGITEAITVTAEEMLESVGHMNTSGYLPTKIVVGEHILGPADWLKAALGVLCGEKTVTILPGTQMPSLDALPGVRDCALKDTWLHPEAFEDEFLSERLRLQAWTMRF